MLGFKGLKGFLEDNLTSFIPFSKWTNARTDKFRNGSSPEISFVAEAITANTFPFLNRIV